MTGKPNNSSFRAAVTLTTAAVIAVAVSAPAPSRAAADPRADKLMVVDCLLPGQVRKLGGKRTYLTPRRPVKTTAAECEIRGGEYVAFDRADYGTSLRIWLPQAKQGDPEAQTYVGEIFEKGLGTEADYDAAATWYKKAAEQGFTRAQINLGQLYEQGLGVPQDMRKALNWYRRASGLEDDDLQFASSVRVTIEAKEKKIQAKEEQIQELQQRSQRSEAAAAELRQQLEQARAELGEREQQLTQTRDRLDDIRRELKQQEQALQSSSKAGRDQLRQELERKESKLQAESQKLSRLQSKVAEQVQSLTEEQREAAERNNELQNRLLEQRANAERLRERLEQVNEELAESRAALDEEEEADAALVARLQAAEKERRNLERQLSNRQGRIGQLHSTLEQVKESLDQSAARYAEAVNELERRKALHEVELQRVKAERDRLKEKSEKDVERIKRLRAKLKKQEEKYAGQLHTLEKEYAQTREKLEQTQEKMAAAEQSESSAIQVASAEPPVIELIEPPVSLTRSGNYTASVRHDVEAREVVGKVKAPAGVKVFSVNEKPAKVDGNGLFTVKVPMKEARTPVSMVVVDKLGQRVSLEFDLFQQLNEAQSSQTAESSQSRSGFPRISGLGDYHALVIGNSEYEDFTDLRTPANDARAVARLFEEEYGYETKLILDATRYEILSALNDYRANLTKDDNLLIYYAGHGEIDEVNNNAFWLPVDAEKENTANWISTRNISEILNVMTAKHVMIVADSCYSGALTRSALARLQGGKTVEQWVRWFKKMSKLRTRMVLSSGGEEPVNDGGGGEHSLFAKAFLKVLEKNDRPLDGYRVHLQISEQVEASIKKQGLALEQTPQYAPIKFAGHEAGEFVFQPI